MKRRRESKEHCSDGKVSWKVIRAALDELEFYYHTDLDGDVWRRCAKAARFGEALPLCLKRNGHGDVTFLLRADDPRQVDQGRIVFMDEGVNFRIIVRRARPPTSDGVRAPYRCVHVEIHGALFSQRATGRSLVEKTRAAVESLFFPERGINRKQRRRSLASITYPSDWHLALDVAVGGKRSGRWVEGTFFANGSRDDAFEPWPKRSMKTGTIPGTEELGRSLIIPGKGCRFTAYERDKMLRQQPEDDKWKKFQRLMKRLGWSPRERLLRNPSARGVLMA